MLRAHVVLLHHTNAAKINNIQRFPFKELRKMLGLLNRLITKTVCVYTFYLRKMLIYAANFAAKRYFIAKHL